MSPSFPSSRPKHEIPDTPAFCLGGNLFGSNPDAALAGAARSLLNEALEQGGLGLLLGPAEVDAVNPA